MRPIVIYASRYGNTERIAQAIAHGISEVTGSEATVRNVDSLFPGDWDEFDPIIIGTPTHFGGPMRTIRRLIDEVARVPGRDHRFAFFDTALAEDSGKSTGKLEARLRAVVPRSRLVAPGASFIVLGMRGPLRDGEMDRAVAHGQHLATEASVTGPSLLPSPAEVAPTVRPAVAAEG